MKQISPFIILFFMVFACSKDTRKKPENLISKAVMVDIMSDIYLINAAKGVNKKIMENNNLHPENYILNKYNIDSLVFAESNDYYALSPDEYNSILENISAKLETKKAYFDSIKKTNEEDKKRKRDSTIKARKAQKPKIQKIDSAKIAPTKIIKER